MKYIKSFEKINKNPKYNIKDIVKLNDKSALINKKLYDELFEITDVYFMDNKFFYQIKNIISDSSTLFIPEYTLDSVSDDELKNFNIKKNAQKYNL